MPGAAQHNNAMTFRALPILINARLSRISIGRLLTASIELIRQGHVAPKIITII
jgi:hypothetical protein